MPISMKSGLPAAGIGFDYYHSLLFDSFESEIEAEASDIRKNLSKLIEIQQDKDLL
jgi:hypothetical protein